MSYPVTNNLTGEQTWYEVQKDGYLHLSDGSTLCPCYVYSSTSGWRKNISEEYVVVLMGVGIRTLKVGYGELITFVPAHREPY